MEQQSSVIPSLLATFSFVLFIVIVGNSKSSQPEDPLLEVLRRDMKTMRRFQRWLLMPAFAFIKRYLHKGSLGLIFAGFAAYLSFLVALWTDSNLKDIIELLRDIWFEKESPKA